MGRQAKATCFSFMICRSNFAEKDSHTVPKVVKISEKKGRQTSSKTSFQELCNIVISETQSPDCNKASQENEATTSASGKDLSFLKNSLILEHTDELNRLEANCGTHSLKHSTVEDQLSYVGNCDTYAVKDSLGVDQLASLSNCDNSEAHSAKEYIVKDPLANNGNCFIHPVKDTLTAHNLEAVGNSDAYSVNDSLGQPAAVGKSNTLLVKDFILEENCIELSNAAESLAAVMDIQYDDEITTASNRNDQEYTPIFIQAAVKRFLAEKDAYKNNAVESQAVVQGHVPRTEAGESLPRTGGIHKIKTFFTARHACQTISEGSAQDKLSKKLQVTGKVSSSTSSMKPMKAHDLAKTDSPWRWLEGRIAHPTRPDMRPGQEITQNEIKPEDKEQKNLAAYDTQDATLIADASFTFHPNPYSHSTKPTEDGLGSLNDYGGASLHFPVTIADVDVNTLESDDHKLFQHSKGALSINDDDMKILRVGGSIDTTKMLLESDATEYDILDIEKEVSKHTTERKNCVNPETEYKQFSASSRDASNSEIANIEMKNGKLPVHATNESASYADQGSESGSGSFQFHFSSSENITELGLEYDPFSYNSYFGNPYIDCSSSVSPMSYLKDEGLDDFGNPENDATKREGNDNVNSDADIASGIKDVNSEMQNSCSHLYVRLEQCNELISMIDSLHVEQHLDESTTSSVYIKLENSKPSDICSSTASSPRSHDGVPDLQRPSSTQISVTAKLSKAERNIYTPQSRIQSSHRCCQSIFKNDPGGIITEYLPKDIKNSNKQKTIGIPGPDHIDSNDNFTPSYMQTTESVRAKFSVDLKSTADGHDNSVKKRPLHTEHGKLNLSTGQQRSLQ